MCVGIFVQRAHVPLQLGELGLQGQVGLRKTLVAGKQSVPVHLESFHLTEGNVLFNDALNTFYLRLYGVRHTVKDRSGSKRGNPLPIHGLLFPITSNGSFICTIPQTG